jgi:predicted DNA-binding transcriptional regulator AlpA
MRTLIACPNSTQMYDPGVDISDLLDASEVAELLGVQRRSVYHMRRYLDGFPQPAITKGRVPLWERKQVEAWRAAHPARHPQKR